MKPEIEQFIIKNYNELKKICVKITDNSSWSDDLLNSVLLMLYEKDDIKLDKLDDNSIRWYIIRCITNNWYSDTSPFYRKVRRESTLYNDLKDIADPPVDDNDFDEHFFMEIIEEEFGALGWFHKDIFTRYMVLGSLKRVSTQTTIPLNSVHRYIKEAKNTVKENTFKKINK